MPYTGRIRGRLTETVVRRAVAQIQRDLRNRELKFTAKERMALHKRVAELQEELKELEITRLTELIDQEEKAKAATPFAEPAPSQVSTQQSPADKPRLTGYELMQEQRNPFKAR